MISVSLIVEKKILKLLKLVKNKIIISIYHFY